MSDFAGGQSWEYHLRRLIEVSPAAQKQHHPQTPFFLLGSPYGVRFPAIEPHNNTLYFSFYTADGYKPGCTPLSNLSLQTSELKSFPLAEAISTQENWHLTPENDSVFISRKYSKPAHLVNIHSWGPLFIDLYEMQVDLGAVIYSQNKLSTPLFLPQDMSASPVMYTEPGYSTPLTAGGGPSLK